MKNLKEKLEIEMLKEMTYTDINKLLNELNQKNDELTEQLRLYGVGSRRELLFAFERMRTSHIIGATDEWRYANVDLFLSK